MRHIIHKSEMSFLTGLLIAVCAGALLLLVFLAVVIDRSFEQNEQLRQVIENSYAAKSALKDVLELHQNIESSQRSYVITDNKKSLEPYRQAEVQIDAKLDAVAKLVAPENSGLIERLRVESIRKRDFIDRIIELVETGRHDEAVRLVSSGEGKQSMDLIRTLIKQLSENERIKLQESTSIADAARESLESRTLRLEIGLILLLAVATFLIVRSQIALHRTNTSDLTARQVAIFDSAKDGMIVLDQSGKIESLNPAVTSMFGIAAQDWLQRDISSLFGIAPARAQIKVFLQRLKVSREEGYAQIQEFVGRRSDGSSFPLEVSVSPVDLADETLFLAVLRDVSERRLIEQMKSEFVTTVSHELRTPLTSISGSLGLINGGAAGEVSPQVGRLIEIAHDNSARLVRLINDILDIEKIEAGRMQFKIRPLALRPLLDMAVQQVMGFAGDYDIAIQIEPFAPDIGVLADEDRLVQVFINLLSNAIKFSHRGKAVMLRVQPLDRFYRVSVIDQGIGIPEAFRDRIFQKFAQADVSDARKKGGTGLGLSIVKEIVTRLGGTVSFESVEGKYTIFHVDLPAAVLPGTIAMHENETAGHKADSALPCILHVDNNPDMLAVVAKAFEGMAAVDSAPSVAEAQDFIQRNRYAAAILDAEMLSEDRTDLVALLHANAPAMPIILFTSQEINNTAERGIDLMLTKSHASLGKLVREVFGHISVQDNPGSIK